MRILLIVVFISTSFFSSAQYFKNKGKIVLNDSTLEGFIKTNTVGITPQSFSFSNTEDGTYSPVDAKRIKRIEYDNGIIFEPHFIALISLYKAYIGRVQDDYAIGKEAGSRFLQQLVMGKYSLYLFKDEFDFPHFFYSTYSDTSLIELIYHPYMDDNGKMVDDNAFRNQVSFLFNQETCTLSNADLTTLKYLESSLRNLFLKLSACTGEPNRNNEIRKTILFVPEAIISLMAYQTHPGDAMPAENWKNRVVAPAFGLSFSLMDISPKQRPGFGIDLLYLSFKTESDSGRLMYLGTVKGVYKFSRLLIRPNIRIYPLRNSHKFYTSAGLIMPLNIHSKLDYISRDGTKSYGYATQSFSAYVGMGLQKKRFSAVIEYSDNFWAKYKTNYYSLSLRYSFVDKPN
jgi:hypothetical protein